MAAVHGTKAEASLVMVKLANKDYERFKSISWDTYICMNYWHIKEVPLYEL